jgi:hypothetical protein
MLFFITAYDADYEVPRLIATRYLLVIQLVKGALARA